MIPTESNAVLRFGILVSESGVQSWQLRCLEFLEMETGTAATAVIVANGATERSGSTRPSPLFYRSIVQQRRDPLTARSPLPIQFSKLPTVLLSPVSSPSPGVEAKDCSEIADLALDFVINFGARKDALQISRSVRLGVWEYQFGQEGEREDSIGFWEVHDDAPLSSGRLVRIGSDAGRVAVLREGHLRTRRTSINANRAQLLDRFLRWPAFVCRDIRNGVTAYPTQPSQGGAARKRAPPSNFAMSALFMRLAWRSMMRVVLKICRHDQWNVGVIHQPISSLLAGDKHDVEWLPGPPKGEFIADPFGIIENGRLTIVCEHLRYSFVKGTIAAAQPAIAEYRQMQIGPVPAVHMSYPFLVEEKGQLFCIPETHEAGEIALYAASVFPASWRRVRALVTKTDTVDATPFQHEGRWWLAGSEPAIDGASAELRLWYADNLEGPWIEHATNPVKIDVRSSRPAGTPFVHEGVLYRPAQDCSHSYGGRTVINKVTTLTPSSYAEETVAFVNPDPGGLFPTGLHTVSAVGNFTLIDGRRWIFSPDEALRCLTGAFTRRKDRNRASRTARP